MGQVIEAQELFAAQIAHEAKRDQRENPGPETLTRAADILFHEARHANLRCMRAAALRALARFNLATPELVNTEGGQSA
jgi:hypothetical protein